MSLFRIVCLSTVLLAGSSVHALEVTSNNEIRKLNSGLEQRLETTRSALTAAFNGLKEEIDGILARLTALETQMTSVRNSQPSAWNTPLENRIRAIETKNTAQDTSISGLNTSVTNHNTRIYNLENKPGGNMSLQITSNCSTYRVGGTSGQTMMSCPSGYVVTGLAQKGLATGSKVWSGDLKCCQITLQ